MAIFHEIGPVGFRANWEEPWNRVFGWRPNVLRNLFPKESPFDPAWVVIALSCNFQDGRVPRIDWTPDAEEERYDCRPILFDTLAHFGITEMLWTTHSITENPEYWVCAPSVDSVWETYWASDDLAAWELTTLLGRDATWGLVSTYEDLSLLGGTPEFMAVYLEKAGGLEFIQDRFRFDDLSRGGWSSFLRGNITQEVVDRYYAMLGWEPPDYEEGWRRLGLAK